jgi:hypothetical protein
VRFYGKGDPVIKCELPWKGFHRSLIRGRIPFFPVNCHHIERDMDKMDVLILPDIAVLTDDQILKITKFVEAGKSLVVTGATGMLDKFGYPVKENRIDNLLGIERLDKDVKSINMSKGYGPPNLDDYEMHNYIRIEKPEHEIFEGFAETSIIAFSGYAYDTRSSTMDALATFIPAFPTYPPEISYMEDSKRRSDQPVVLAGVTPYGGRVVYLAGDIDRRYGHANIPDHGDLLTSCIRWALNGKSVLSVKGGGYLDCKLYRQNDNYLLHVGNLSGLNQWPGYVEEHYPVGPLEIAVKVDDLDIKTAECRVSGNCIDVNVKNNWASFVLDKVVNHELVIL